VGGGEPIAFLVRSHRNRFLRNVVRAYAGEGWRLDGANGNVLKHNRAIGNGDHGFRVQRGERNLFFHNTAQGNLGEGFRSQDRDNRLESNTATHNGDEGIRLKDASAQNNLVTGNAVQHNGLSPCNPLADIPDVNPGIAVTRGAANNQIKNNKVSNNCIGIGIEDGSKKNKLVKNKVSKSKLMDMVDGNSHCANNDWRRNKFKTSVSGPFPPGVLFPPCIRFGDLLDSVADRGQDIVSDGGSLVKDAGSAIKDIKSPF
jgi:parallel beta-helix repeat protein